MLKRIRYKLIIKKSKLTWAAVELHRLRDVAGAEPNPLPDFRQCVRVVGKVVARKNRVKIRSL